MRDFEQNVLVFGLGPLDAARQDDSVALDSVVGAALIIVVALWAMARKGPPSNPSGQRSTRANWRVVVAWEACSVLDLPIRASRQ